MINLGNIILSIALIFGTCFLIPLISKLFPEKEDDSGNLKQCPTCGGQVSKSAETCPHCGEKLKGQSIASRIFWFVLAIISLVLVFAQSSNLFRILNK